MSVSVSNFVLSDQFGKEVRFADLAGKKFLLSFHPLAWTPVCTRQMMDLDVMYDKFIAKGIIPFGVSVDTLYTKKVWGAAMAIQKLQMLADFWPHGELAKTVGCFIEKGGQSGRSHFLVDESGKIVWSKRNEIHEQPDFKAILAEMP